MTFDEEGENILLRGRLTQQVQLGEHMVERFEKVLMKGGLDKVISSQLENVFNTVNKKVKKHIKLRRQESISKKESDKELKKYAS